MSAISLIGKRVDIIYYCLGELARMNREIRAESMELIEIESSRRELSKYLRIKFVFVRFNT